MRKSGFEGIFILLLGICVLFIPCGATAVEVQGVTDTTIKLGSINDTAGPIAAYGIPRVEADMALVRHVNDQGGIHGRKIIFINEPDYYSPPKTVLAFRKLMDVDKVFCLMSGMGVAGTLAIMPEVQRRKIPYLMVGGNSSKLFEPAKRYIFAPYPTFEDFMKILVDYLAINLKMPKANVVHLYQEDGTGWDSKKGLNDQVNKFYPEIKLTEIGIKRATVDVSPYVAKAKAANPDVVMISSIFVTSAMVCKEMQKIGWKPRILMNATNGTGGLIKLGGSAVEGITAQMTYPLLTDVHLPGVKLYQELIKKYYPNSKANPSAFGMSGFIEMQVGFEALKRAGRNLTREGVVEALHTFKDVDLGILPPLTFTPTQHKGNDKVNIVQVKNGKWIKLVKYMGFRK